MSHGDHVSVAPPGFTITATTDRIPVAAMANEESAGTACSSTRK